MDYKDSSSLFYDLLKMSNDCVLKITNAKITKKIKRRADMNILVSHLILKRESGRLSAAIRRRTLRTLPSLYLEGGSWTFRRHQQLRVNTTFILLFIESNGISTTANMSQKPHCCPQIRKGSLTYEALKGAATGEVKLVTSFLENGGDVNGGDLTGRTMLHAACEHGRLEVVKELLKCPDLHLNSLHMGAVSLAKASVNGHVNCVQALLESSLQCKVNMYIKWTMADKTTSITAIGAASANRQWNVVRVLIKAYEDISIHDEFLMIDSALKDDQWDIISEILQKDISYQSVVYLTVLKEAYVRHLWDVIEVVFRKAVIHDNNLVLLFLSDLVRKRDWEKLESLLWVLDDTVKVDVNMAEALRAKQNEEVAKMLHEDEQAADTLSGCLLLACICGTNEKVAEELMSRTSQYSDQVLKFALILSTMHNRLELLPLLLQKGNFSMKTLGHARALDYFDGCEDVSKILKMSFAIKACGLFPNATKILQLDLGEAILDDSDQTD